MRGNDDAFYDATNLRVYIIVLGRHNKVSMDRQNYKSLLVLFIVFKSRSSLVISRCRPLVYDRVHHTNNVIAILAFMWASTLRSQLMFSKESLLYTLFLKFQNVGYAASVLLENKLHNNNNKTDF